MGAAKKLLVCKTVGQHNHPLKELGQKNPPLISIRRYLLDG
jgi:hypothetical protein